MDRNNDTLSPHRNMHLSAWQYTPLYLYTPNFLRSFFSFPVRKYIHIFFFHIHQNPLYSFSPFSSIFFIPFFFFLLSLCSSTHPLISSTLLLSSLYVKTFQFFPLTSFFLNFFSRYIPAAAAFGGMCIGLLTVLADFLGERETHSQVFKTMWKT